MSAVMKISEERIMKVLLKCATKPEIKAAVENLFKVEVESVQVLNRMGKKKRSGRTMGRKNNQKLAYVCLKPGQEIHFTEEGK